MSTLSHSSKITIEGQFSFDVLREHFCLKKTKKEKNVILKGR